MSEEEKVEEGAVAGAATEEAAAAPAESPPEGADAAEAANADTGGDAEPGGEAPAAEEGESAAPDESGNEVPVGEAAGTPPEAPAGGTDVRPAEFQPIRPEETIAAGNNLDLILGVTVPVTIDLGGTVMPLKEVLALGPGSVVKLDRPLGEPVDIKVNGELVGRGEVVVVDDQFGVQVTELCRPVGAGS